DRPSHRQAREVEHRAAAANRLDQRVEESDRFLEAVAVEHRVAAGGVVPRSLFLTHRGKGVRDARDGTSTVPSPRSLTVSLDAKQEARTRPLLRLHDDRIGQAPSMLVMTGQPGGVRNQL